MRKYIFYIALLFGLLAVLPSGVMASNLIFSDDTEVYLSGLDDTVTIVQGSNVDKMTVYGSSIVFDMVNGSSVTIRSPDRYTMRVEEPVNYSFSCGTDYSTINFSSLTTQTVTVEVSSTICQPGAGEVSESKTTTGGGVVPIREKPKITIEELKAKIAEIQAKIAQLQAQLKQLLGQQATEVKFTKNLKYGMTGDEVRALQECLAKDSSVYPEGLVTGYFGPLTKAAVIRFQEKYFDDILAPWGFTKGTGFVGPTTRKKLNEICQ